MLSDLEPWESGSLVPEQGLHCEGALGEGALGEGALGAWPDWAAVAQRNRLGRSDPLFRNWDDLTTFYDFPAEHWIHLRTSNPVSESVFAGVRLRTNVSKRMRRRDSALYLVFKITQRLELGWRPLNGGLTLVTLLLRGARFVDGIYIPTEADRQGFSEDVSAA